MRTLALAILLAVSSTASAKIVLKQAKSGLSFLHGDPTGVIKFKASTKAEGDAFIKKLPIQRSAKKVSRNFLTGTYTVRYTHFDSGPKGLEAVRDDVEKAKQAIEANQ